MTDFETSPDGEAEDGSESAAPIRSSYDWKIAAPANKLPPDISRPSLRQPVLCRHTGVTLATLEVLIVEGSAPFLQDFGALQIVHPFFGASEYHLLRKLEESLNYCWDRQFDVDMRHIERIQVLMVAIMHRMNCFSSDGPTLPAQEIAIGSAHRLFRLARWWMLSTTRRIQLPVFSVTRRNDNRNWQNFRAWLDVAFERKVQWETQKQKLETDEELRVRDAAVREVRKSGTGRMNLVRVWNWVELQLRGHIASGRIATFKELFFKADLEPENWLKDDIDDFGEAVLEYIDIGNDIALFVRDRLGAAYEALNEYYDSFVVVNRAQRSFSEAPSVQELQAEATLFADYDAEVASWTEVPPPPNTAGMGLAQRLKAESRHRLLVARWNFLQARKLDPNAGRPSVAPVGTLQRVQRAIEDRRNAEILGEDQDEDDGEDGAEPEPALI